MKKKILFLNPSLRQGGVEHSLVTLLNLLDPEKYEITLFLYADMLDLLPRVPAHVRVINGTDRTRYFRQPAVALPFAAYRLLKLLGKKEKAEAARREAYRRIHEKKVSRPQRRFFGNERFDTVVSYSLHIGTEMALRINADRYVVVMHSSDPAYHREIIETALPHYHTVAAVSESVERVYRTHYPTLAEKLVHIDNYVDGERILRLSKEPAPALENPDGAFRIATCGRLSHEKGFDLAVEAAAELRRRGKNFRWLFIGDGDERGALERRIRELGLQERIGITGFLVNPYPYMASCDLYVQPSYEEAQPLTVLEAMLLGRPVVSTDTVGGRHILEDGKKGVLTKIDAQAIAEAVLRCMEDPGLSRFSAAEEALARNLAQRDEYIRRWDRLLEKEGT